MASDGCPADVSAALVLTQFSGNILASHQAGEIDLLHKSHNTPVPYPTMHQLHISQCPVLKQKYAHAKAMKAVLSSVLPFLLKGLCQGCGYSMNIDSIIIAIALETFI